MVRKVIRRQPTPGERGHRRAWLGLSAAQGWRCPRENCGAALAGASRARGRPVPGERGAVCLRTRLGCYPEVAVPDAMTVVRRKSPSSRTMSADRPGARAPVSADRPRRRAGVVLAAAATSGTRRPTAVIACLTTWSIVAVEPAIAPRALALPSGAAERPEGAGVAKVAAVDGVVAVGVRRATPAVTVTARSPRR